MIQPPRISGFIPFGIPPNGERILSLAKSLNYILLLAS